jgi:hypothetical protein
MPITSADGRPHTGARFELDLVSVSETEARYRAQVHQALGHQHYQLTIQLAGGPGRGACSLVETTGAAPAEGDWTRSYLLALGRQLFRAADKDGTWQRRLNRWRPERE